MVTLLGTPVQSSTVLCCHNVSFYDAYNACFQTLLQGCSCTCTHAHVHSLNWVCVGWRCANCMLSLQETWITPGEQHQGTLCFYSAVFLCLENGALNSQLFWPEIQKCFNIVITLLSSFFLNLWKIFLWFKRTKIGTSASSPCSGHCLFFREKLPHQIQKNSIFFSSNEYNKLL